MPPEPDIQKYCDQMEEVKTRIAVIDFYITGAGHALYKPTTIESAALQLRKTMEVIAMASLIANKDLYSKAHADFAKKWHAGELLKSLQKINPDFYPKPVVETPVDKPPALHQLKERQPDFLTKAEFEEVYGRCGVILHSANPFGNVINYDFFALLVGETRTKIVNLLNNHQIRLVGEPGFYLIHMKENQDDKVHYYRFQPAPRA
jgi:hypothetical protein